MGRRLHRNELRRTEMKRNECGSAGTDLNRRIEVGWLFRKLETFRGGRMPYPAAKSWNCDGNPIL